MQLIDVNQTVFSLSLVGALVLGSLFAALVRWASRKKWVGQTAWAVVIGVTFTLLLAVPTVGLQVILIIFCFFAATGAPMIVEYLTRIMQEIREDNESAKKVASEYLDDRQTGNR